MRKDSEGNVGGYIHRHLSQLKILARLVDHELGAAKAGTDITMDREVLENLLDTLEIFIEDLGEAEPRKRSETRVASTADSGKNVTRLN